MDTSPKNQRALRHDATRPAPRAPQPGEPLFAFLRGHDRFTCELRDHGRYGVEPVLSERGVLLATPATRTFDQERSNRE